MDICRSTSAQPQQQQQPHDALIMVDNGDIGMLDLIDHNNPIVSTEHQHHNNNNNNNEQRQHILDSTISSTEPHDHNLIQMRKNSITIGADVHDSKESIISSQWQSNVYRPINKNPNKNMEEIIDHHYYHYRQVDYVVPNMSYTWSYQRSNLLAATNSLSTYTHRTFKFELLNKNGVVKGLCPLARSGHRIVSDKHYVYLFGGFNPDVLASARVPDDEQWKKTKPLFKELWRYSKLTQTWHYLRCSGTAPVELASPCALLLEPNHLMIYGGSGMPFGSSSSNKMYICDLDRLHWSRVIYENESHSIEDGVDVSSDDQPNQIDSEIPEPAYGQAICYDRDNDLIYVCGGTTGFDYSLNLHEFNLQTRKWRLLSRTPESIEPRYRHEMALYQRKLFIIGGGTSGQSFSMDKIPVFDLAAKQWSLVESKPWQSGEEQMYPAARYSHDCGQIGRLIYMVGGADQRQAFADCWSLDLETLQWTKHVGCSLPQPCYFHSATISPNDGEMFVFGGVNCVQRKRRSDAMYRCWLSVPSLQRMAQEAIIKFLHNKQNNVSENNNISGGCTESKRKKNDPYRHHTKPRLSIKYLHEYFQCMQISYNLLNLPKF
ncbi:kelch domain-containing protein 10-like protein [Dermatophagoides farinae]|uniref:Kelch domain-containing protein 10-like protein n=1 Tax=Dermatophagoides farinae TaxID=6954 RepID=A0A9D4NWW9_DERFA|nr:kelch domain-containing protein 10-like protein [Dermatophagoides farinae]